MEMSTIIPGTGATRFVFRDPQGMETGDVLNVFLDLNELAKLPRDEKGRVHLKFKKGKYTDKKGNAKYFAILDDYFTKQRQPYPANQGGYQQQNNGQQNHQSGYHQNNPQDLYGQSNRGF